MSKPILITIYNQHDRSLKYLISILNFNELKILERNYGTWGQMSICLGSDLKTCRGIFADYNLRPIRQVNPLSGGEVGIEKTPSIEWFNDW